MDAIGNETAQSIRDIGAALVRLEEGTYGECEACGGSIGEARLEVMPEAARCVACADRACVEDVLRRHLAPGDVVLVKGSRSMGMERVVGALTNGSTSVHTGKARSA